MATPITATYVSINNFTTAGDLTSFFQTGRRVQADCGVDGYRYSTISGSSFGATTSVVVYPDAGTNNLTSNLTGVLFGIVGVNGEHSLPNHTHLTDDGEGNTITEAAINNLDKYTQAQVDNLISAAALSTATTYYLHEDADVIIAGYEQLRSTPSDDAEAFDSVTITTTSGEVLIEPYVTISGSPNTDSIQAGTWTANIWASVSAVSQGPHYLRAKWCRRTPDGTEYWKFTQEIPITSASPTQYFVQTTTSGWDMDLDDRLVVKMYAETDAGGDRTIGYYVEGENRAAQFNTPVLTNLITSHSELTNLDSDDHLQYHTDGRADTWFGGKSIADLGTKDHDLLNGLTDDDHTQYSLVNGTRAFTGAVGGITPVVDADLSTKGYVDTADATLSGYLQTQINNIPSDTTLSGYLQGQLDDHIADTANPHSVTSTQVLPSQGGHGDEVLWSNGTSVYWAVASGGGGGGITSISGTLAGDLALGAYGIELNPTPAADHSFSGFFSTVTISGNDTGIGAALYMKQDGYYYEACASGVNSAITLCLATETGTGSRKVLEWGYFRDDSWTWTSIGTEVYLHPSTPGALTQTIASGSGEYLMPIGIATHADRIKFVPTYDLAGV